CARIPDTTRFVSGRAHARASAPHSNVDSRCGASENSPLSIAGLPAQSSGKLNADQTHYAAVFLCDLFATETTHGAAFRHSIASISRTESLRRKFAKRLAIWNCLQWVRSSGKNNAVSLQRGMIAWRFAARARTILKGSTSISSWEN